MKPRELLENVRPRERFESIRRKKDDRFNLRVRMTLMVASELVFSAMVAIAVAALLRPYLEENFRFWMPLVLILTSLIVGTAITSLLSKVFFDPFKKLMTAMEQVADGDFSVRLEEQSSSKEVMEIYTGFNMMAHELGATEMLQSDFVSNVSHEFKTPITAIEGFSVLLQESENLDEDQQDCIDKIIFNSRRLSSLLGSILLLNKLENQQVATKQSKYRLDEQIRQSVVALEPAWEQKNIELDVDLDRTYYCGSEAMMRHVWDNLIANAIKFTPENSTVRILLREEGAHLTVRVADQGPGLSEETQKHMFDKFYQGDTSHKQDGNGLGLALVKRILSIEQAGIYAENLPEGGCCFTVKLSNP